LKVPSSADVAFALEGLIIQTQPNKEASMSGQANHHMCSKPCRDQNISPPGGRRQLGKNRAILLWPMRDQPMRRKFIVILSDGCALLLANSGPSPSVRAPHAEPPLPYMRLLRLAPHRRVTSSSSGTDEDAPC
jgi:hypothetical protein